MDPHCVFYLVWFFIFIIEERIQEMIFWEGSSFSFISTSIINQVYYSFKKNRKAFIKFLGKNTASVSSNVIIDDRHSMISNH